MPDELTALARATWSLGRYDELVAPRLVPAAQALCDAAEVRAGMCVLDVAAGTGNVTAAALARGAEVVASDVSPHLIEQGRARTGDRVAWHEADARELPFHDGTFDAVLSNFGVIFAPEPERVAAELLRVTASGGVVALSAWMPEGVQGTLHRVLGRHLPPPPDGFSPPEAWGRPDVAVARLAPYAADVRTQPRTLTWAFEGGVDSWLAMLEEGAPPFVAAKQAIGVERWPAVREELRAHLASGAEPGPDGGCVAEASYLLITARARGSAPASRS
jgi:SAM-dependent methyltransferase